MSGSQCGGRGKAGLGSRFLQLGRYLFPIIGRDEALSVVAPAPSQPPDLALSESSASFDIPLRGPRGAGEPAGGG